MSKREYNFFNTVECSQRRQKGHRWQTRNILRYSRSIIGVQLPGIRGENNIQMYNPTSARPTSTEPTSTEPTSAKPTSTESTSARPTSLIPTSVSPTSTEPTSTEPTSAELTSAEPTSAVRGSSEHTLAQP